ncbi:MAG: acyl-ACP--UDP-N-acetylglucosamine O-acyltransferase [Chthonomonadales bacterium]
MATQIHPTAIVHPGAHLEDGVVIGPYCVVGDDVQIGSGTQLEPHVVLEPGTRIGRNCRIWPGAVIGGPPQDHKYRGEKSFVVIGDDNVIRECVTIHRAVGEGNVTRIGSGNWFMAYAHVGHNCEIGDNNTIASYVGLSGHVTVESNVVMGGMVGVHQFTRIGRLAMIGGVSKVNQDIPPFMLADGVPVRVIELNRIGLKRHGIPPNVRSTLRQAYKLLYRSNLNRSEAITRIEEELEISEELDYLITFMRGIASGYGGRGNDTPRA